MASQWVYQVMGDEVGPISSAELRDLAQRGAISVDTLVRKAPDDAWISAERVQGLFPVPDETPRPMPAVVSAPVEARPTDSSPGRNRDRPDALILNRVKSSIARSSVVVLAAVASFFWVLAGIGWCIGGLMLATIPKEPSSFLLFLGVSVLLDLLLNAGVGFLVGRKFGDGELGIAWGILLGPLGWLIMFLCDSRPKCPACLARIDVGARVCHCCRQPIAY